MEWLPPLSAAAFAVFVQVVLIDVALAGDNAIIIGVLAARLPPPQRPRAILTGTLLALVCRIGFALAASWLLQFVGLILAGGLLLLGVAWKLWRELRAPDAAALASAGAVSLASITWAIAVADVSMSLDNVLAVAGAARRHAGIMIVGLVLSVALTGFAASLVARLIGRFRWIGYVGLAVIIYVAVNMIIDGTRELG